MVNQKIINPYKTGLGFQMLSQYLGNESVDLSIKEYVRLNSLNNINYVSFQQLFKLKNNNSKWFFNDYLKSKSKGDYSIKKNPHIAERAS